MKRAFTFILSILILMAFAACGRDEKPLVSPTTAPGGTEAPYETAAPIYTEEPYAFVPETDFDNRFSKLVNNTFIELDECYVWRFDSSPIFYWDKTMQDSGALCNKPECDHHNSDCNAFINVIGNMSFYEGRLYYMVYGKDTKDGKLYYSVMSMKPDSTDMREEQRIYRDEGADYDASNVFVHRGFVFLYYNYQIVEKMVPYNCYRVEIMELGKSERKTIYELKTQSSQKPILQFRGNEVYIARGRGDEHTSYIELTVYNIVSGKNEQTEYDVGVYDTCLSDFYITPEGELLFAFDTDYDKFPGGVFTIKDGKAVEKFRFDDGEHIFIPSFADGVACVVATIDPDVPTFMIWISDFEGNTIYKGELPMEYRNSITEAHSFVGRDMLVGSGSSLFVIAEEGLDAGNGTVYFLIRYDFSPNGITETVLGTFEEHA